MDRNVRGICQGILEPSAISLENFVVSPKKIRYGYLVLPSSMMLLANAASSTFPFETFTCQLWQAFQGLGFYCDYWWTQPPGWGTESSKMARVCCLHQWVVWNTMITHMRNTVISHMELPCWGKTCSDALHWIERLLAMPDTHKQEMRYREPYSLSYVKNTTCHGHTISYLTYRCVPNSMGY